ncbi:hypothetical protein [Actinopolymorpha singaporensis]|uniref:hypothetical protein n=1 Tax=Actinopolymorpha singaporensis TaxID=117157 RepID=UPI0018D3ABBA|nr:hypothetical protein [Actinopolymorpha singaporensis]
MARAQVANVVPGLPVTSSTVGTTACGCRASVASPSTSRDDARPALGRRPRLSVDQVVAAAVTRADADGILAMAMSGVAKALGVGTMTLYT